MPTYTLAIPAPGFVEIIEETHAVRYDEGALRAAIYNTQRTRASFADEEHYRNTLNMFESALKLLLEDWS